MPTASDLFAQAVHHHQAGRLPDAESICRAILSHDPNDASATQLLGLIVHRTGNTAGATALLRRAATLNPNAADIQTNLGSMLASAGQWSEAVIAFTRAIELRPDLPEPRLNLGKALQQSGQSDGAIRELQGAITLRPDYAEAHYQLALAYLSKSLPDKASDAFRRALSIRPDHVEAMVGLGNILHSLGRFQEAESAYRQAASTRPTAPEPFVNLGIALLELGRTDEAISSLRRAISLQTTHADAWYYLAGALRRSGQLDEAVAAYNQCLSFRPDFADALANLGNALRDRRQLDEAFDCYRRAMALTPASWPAQSLIYSLYFHPDYDGPRILAEHRKWNDTYARPLLRPRVSHANDRNPDRKLRIGYVSPDFRNHCQAIFTIPLLSHHDHGRFEIYCYSGVRRPDEMTARIRALADVWRDLSTLSDDAAADLIRSDAIDILVDLSMHMDQTRLPVFARKPAPVQVTWLAYPGTTGLETMDYRLTDPRLDPTDQQRETWYSEKTVRLPDTFWCYDPLTDNPPVNELPALGNGFITFGCLNNFSKITAPTLELWAAILKALPTSRLIVLTPPGSAREALLKDLSARGIDPARIEPIDRLTREAYLAAYNRFDLCLDTFPYNGHTTTLDSLWMGVPPITLAGQTAVSRGGLSILHNVDLSRFVAHTPTQAVEIATSVAADLPALAQIRRGLRPLMQSSPLMDAPLFAQHMESAFRSLWRELCATAM